MECGVYEVFTIAVAVIAIAMILFAIMFNPKLVKVSRTDVERVLSERIDGAYVSHQELQDYLAKHYPNLDAHVSNMEMSEAYSAIAEHLHVHFNANELMPVIAGRLLLRAKNKLYADRSGDEKAN